MDENTEPLVVVLGRIPPRSARELERRAREDDRTLSWVVRQAVDHYLQFEGGADHHPALPSIHHATKGVVT